MTIINQRQYDPMLIGGPARKALFNEVAALVAPKEGKAYLDTIAAEKGGVTADDYNDLPAYVGDTASGMCFGISTALIIAFGRSAEAESQRVRDEYKKLAAEHEQHFNGQIRKGDALTAEEKIFNANVEIHVATARTLFDRLLARLPQ